MVVSSERINQSTLHPLHGILLAATIPLFGGVMLSDLAYASSYQIQWSNFASWLVVGGLIFSGLAMVWAIARLLVTPHRDRDSVLYLFLLVSTWVLGFFNSLVHARDAWAMMPTGLILSVIIFLIACASNWIGFVRFGVGGQR